jgi:hypothetical protein
MQVFLNTNLTSLFPDLLGVTRDDVVGTCELLCQYPRLSVLERPEAAAQKLRRVAGGVRDRL